MNMLKAHNSKTQTVIEGFNKYQKLRQQSKEEGIPFEQLVSESNDLNMVKRNKKIYRAKK